MADRDWVSVPGWLVEDRAVSDGVLRTWLVLALVAGDDGAVRLSPAEIAERRGLGVRQVARHLEVLVRAGAVCRSGGYRWDGRWAPMGYRLVTVREHVLPDWQSDKNVQPDDPSDKNVQRKVAATTQTLPKVTLGSNNNILYPEKVSNTHAVPSSEASSCSFGESSLLDTFSGIAGREVRRDLLWETLLEVCGISGQPTRSARGAYNRALADLREVGATVEDIRQRAAVFRARWPNASLTPTALARRWAECEPDPRHLPARRVTQAEAALARIAAEDAQQPVRRTRINAAAIEAPARYQTPEAPLNGSESNLVPLTRKPPYVAEPLPFVADDGGGGR